MAEIIVVNPAQESDAFTQRAGLILCGLSIVLVIVFLSMGGWKRIKPTAASGLQQAYTTPVNTAVYPKRLSIPINRNTPSQPIIVEAYEEFRSVLYEKVPLVTIINGQEKHQTPGSNIDFPDGQRYQVAYMVDRDATVNDPGATGLVEVTITHR